MCYDIAVPLTVVSSSFSSYNVLTAIFHCVFLLTHRKHLQSGVLEHQVGDF